MGRKVIFVSVERQKLYLIEDGNVKKEYPVSTSRYGTGNKLGSEKTPIGIHRIYKKIGSGLPENTIFVGRVPYSPEEAKQKFGELKDKIMTRILWLEGCEEGVNKGKDENGDIVDTKERYIYIHGTDEEVGKPGSRGCIRMRNKDIIELFDEVEEGDLVLIF